MMPRRRTRRASRALSYSELSKEVGGRIEVASSILMEILGILEAFQGRVRQSRRADRSNTLKVAAGKLRRMKNLVVFNMEDPDFSLRTLGSLEESLRESSQKVQANLAEAERELENMALQVRNLKHASDLRIPSIRSEIGDILRLLDRADALPNRPQGMR
jgi:hypothetical protein